MTRATSPRAVRADSRARVAVASQAASKAAARARSARSCIRHKCRAFRPFRSGACAPGGDDRLAGASAGQHLVGGRTQRQARHRPDAGARSAAAAGGRPPCTDPAAPWRPDHRDQRGRAVAAARAAARARSLDCRRCCAPQHAPRNARRLLKMAEQLGSLRKRKRRCPGLPAPALRAQELSCRPARAIPSSPVRSCPVMPCRGASITCTIARCSDIATATSHHAEVIRAVVVGDEKAAVAASDRLMDYVEELTRATVTGRF